MKRLILFIALSIFCQAAEPLITQVVSPLAGIPYSQSLDVDGDGDLDLIEDLYSGIIDSVGLFWCENLGSKKFTSPKVIFYHHENEIALKYGDFNDDGWIDLLSVFYDDTDTMTYYVCFGSKNGGYASRMKIAENTMDYWSTEDSTSGKGTLLIQHTEDTAMFWKISSDKILVPAFSFSAITLPTLYEYDILSYHDVNADGIPEIFITDIIDTSIYQINPNGTLNSLPSAVIDLNLSYDGFSVTPEGDIYSFSDGILTYVSHLGNLQFASPSITDITNSVGRDSILTGIHGSKGNHKAIFTLAEPSEDVADSYEIKFISIAIDKGFTSEFASMGTFIAGSYTIIADFNVDGFTDAVMTGSNTEIFWGKDDSIRTLETITADKQLAWQYGQEFYSGYTGHSPLTHLVADFDSDGDLDIITGWGKNSEIYLYKNNGKGDFSSVKKLQYLIPEALRKKGVVITDLKNADFNRDRKEDILVSMAYESENGTTNTSIIYYGLSNGKFLAPKIKPSSFGSHEDNTPTKIVDWNQDGKLDVFYRTHWRKNRGGKLENKERHIMNEVTTPNDLTLFNGYNFGDVNGDKKLDCLAGIAEFQTEFVNSDEYRFTTKSGIFLGNKKRVFTSHIPFSLNSYQSDALGNPIIYPTPILFDANSDGKLDIIYKTSDTADIFGNPISHTSIAFNDGSPILNPDAWQHTRIDFPEVMQNEPVDFNGDKIKDLCGPNQYLTATKNGPVISENFNFDGDLEMQVAEVLKIADFDKDGDADTLYANLVNGAVFLIKNTIK